MMTFELSPEQQAARAGARALARERIIAAATAIDATATIPSDLLQDVQQACAQARHDATLLVVVIEEIAAASAAIAAAGALGRRDGTLDLPGLRGFNPTAASDDRARLVFAAVALGIGRAALDAALEVLRRVADAEQEKPHWVVADAAADVAAARLLVLQGAQALAATADASAATAMAKLAATRAAQQAVDCAIRVAGADAFARGGLLERLSRDVRTVSLMMGNEEELRAMTAHALLPN